MQSGDFYGTEQSVILDQTGDVKIEWVTEDGSTKVLKEKTAVLAGEVIDAAVMSVKALRSPRPKTSCCRFMSKQR
jgi:isocitrate dehydrogenase